MQNPENRQGLSKDELETITDSSKENGETLEEQKLMTEWE